MNLDPSTSSQPGAAPDASRRSGRSLRWRLVGGVGIGAVIVLGIVGYAGIELLKRSVAGDEDDHLVNATALSKQLVERVLDERARQVELIAAAPSVVAAAEKGTSVSRDRGLPKMSIPQLEQMFKDTRSQQVDPSAMTFLDDLLKKLDIAEVMVTDQYGYNAVTTSPSSDFVQSDEGWWQTAWNTGSTTAQATADPATQRTVVELSAVVRDHANRVGVVKVKFGLSIVDSVLAQGSAGGGALRVDLVDSTGKVIASSVAGRRFKPFTAFTALTGHDGGHAFTYGADSARQRGAVASANGGQWQVVAHMDLSDATHTYDVARWSMLVGMLAIFALVLAALFLVGRFIEQRITLPAAQLAMVAEAVAAGDLSKHIALSSGDDEIGRLARAITAMIAELRHLATALKESTVETTSMTTEITASSEEMAASAGQIAHTASDLSSQATSMAETITALAESSENLVHIASDLDTGAHEGVDRNTKLRALALENRARLDESTNALSTLSSDVEASAAAIEQLAQASEEVRSFVTLVQKLARQSKLLSLNAAMEAARAGEHGHGFAVVAEEVRRLAAMSSDAAEKTEVVVSGVLRGIEQSRHSSERTVHTVHAVSGATQEGSRSFGQIEAAVAEAEGWTGSVQRTVTAANALARTMRSKLDMLATGTDSFAAAMEEVAASSEEQSASTEQIAAAASTLSGAADHLSKLVANLRLEQPTAAEPSRTSGPIKIPGDPLRSRLTPVRGAHAIKI
jgi:methyl-accepting chemotaxis protein